VPQKRALRACAGRESRRITSQRVGRGFHQLGLLLAATLLTIGLPLMVADGVRLKLWDVGQGDILVLVAGVLIALVGLGIACLAVYGVVRAIG
jgi:hypothetical protein